MEELTKTSSKVYATSKKPAHVPIPVYTETACSAMLNRARATRAWTDELNVYLLSKKHFVRRNTDPHQCAHQRAYIARARDPAPKGYTKSTKGRDAEVWAASRNKEWDGAQARSPPTFSEGHSIRKVLAEGHKLHMLHWVFKVKPDKDKSRIVLNGKEQDPSTYDDMLSQHWHTQTPRRLPR